jgi:hypothetical protein
MRHGQTFLFARALGYSGASPNQFRDGPVQLSVQFAICYLLFVITA